MLVRPSFVREFGPDLLDHVHPDAANLPGGIRERLHLFREALGQSFTAESLAVGVCHAANLLFPGDRLLLFPSVHRGTPPWTVNNLENPSVALIKNAQHLAMEARYLPKCEDIFANRAINLSTLVLNWPGSSIESFERTYQNIFAPNQIHHQIRIVLYDDLGEAELFVGFFRPRGSSPFEPQDLSLLQAALPDFAQWYRITKAIGVSPLGDGALPTILDTHETPCWLVTQGCIVFANQTARRKKSTPAWVLQDSIGSNARRVPLAPEGNPMTLVMGERDQERIKLIGLPPSLRAVAELAAQGKSDKEIAAIVKKPANTVRTYMSRIFSRLGVRSRRELIRGY